MRQPPDSKGGFRSSTAPATVHLPSALVRLFPGCERRIEVSASTVQEVLDLLDHRWPGIRDRLCDPRPNIRRHIHIFVDGERADLATRLRPGAEVFVIAAISGG